jgi:hypothetical protein
LKGPAAYETLLDGNGGHSYFLKEIIGLKGFTGEAQQHDVWQIYLGNVQGYIANTYYGFGGQPTSHTATFPQGVRNPWRPPNQFIRMSGSNDPDFIRNNGYDDFWSGLP